MTSFHKTGNLRFFSQILAIGGGDKNRAHMGLATETGNQAALPKTNCLNVVLTKKLQDLMYHTNPYAKIYKLPGK